MNNSLSQQAKFSQSICMTQELQQSIKLLQLSTIELNEYIDQQLESNPLLEIGEVEKFDYLQNNFSKTQNYSNYDNFIENIQSDQKSLKSYIIEQIQYNIKCLEDIKIALDLSEIIDENGFIAQDEIDSLIKEKNYNYENVNKIILKLQEFEPAGLFAKNLTETIILQLKRKNLYDDKTSKLLDNIELLYKNNEAQLLAKCRISKKELYQIINNIKSVNLRPGNVFNNEQTKYIEPDVILKLDNNKNYIIILNNRYAKSLYVNDDYYKSIKNNLSLSDKKYLSSQYYTANYLIKSIDQRDKTIVKITKTIIEKQKKFFDLGIMYLKPLTLKQVADELGIHESTVSRVTTNKYISTPRGIFELKYFFSSTISSKHNVRTSSSITIKHMIKNLISNEKEDIFSDDQISEMLQKLNIDIARRTVAKYRESLNLPTSQIRKRQKRIESFC